MSRTKYSDDDISIAVAESRSIAGVLRLLGIRPAGGSHFHISKRIKALGLDTSHFTGKAHNRGETMPLQRKTPGQILVLRDAQGSREKPHLLRRALTEAGIPIRCAICGTPATWEGRPLTLHVDHINGNPHDCRIHNLRFLCPNCHSQTSTYCRKGSSREAMQRSA